MPLDEIALKGELDATAANQAQKGAYDLAYLQALLDVAKGSLDRSRSAAELVQKSAAAIGTLYAAVLGLSFSVTDHRLPVRAIIPTVFLGLAITLSTVYIAYLTRSTYVNLEPLHTSPPERLQRHLNNFYKVVAASVEHRVYWLRASVLAVGLGLILLPAPFITLPNSHPPAAATQYAWPSPAPVTSDREASLEAIVFKAKVDEVTAQRRKAELEQSESDLGPWLWVVGIGLLLVALVPVVARGFPGGFRWPWQRPPTETVEPGRLSRGLMAPPPGEPPPPANP